MKKELIFNIFISAAVSTIVAGLIALITFHRISNLSIKVKTVESENIDIVDSKGALRIRLSANLEGMGKAGIEIGDTKGIRRISVAMLKSGEPVIVIRNQEKTNYAMMTMARGQPMISITGSSGKEKISIGIRDQEGSGIFALGEDGPHFQLGKLYKGPTIFSMQDQNGTTQAALRVEAKGEKSFHGYPYIPYSIL